MANTITKLSLSAIVLVALTITILVGIALTTSFSEVLRNPTTISDVNTTVTTSLAAVNASTILGDLPFLQSLDDCYNGSNGATLTSDNFSIGVGDGSGGTLILTMNNLGVGWVGNSLNCSSISYLADTQGQASADTFTLGLAIFGTFAGIIVLAIVGIAIVGLFKKKEE